LQHLLQTALSLEKFQINAGKTGQFLDSESVLGDKGPGILVVGTGIAVSRRGTAAVICFPDSIVLYCSFLY
jgi:hypothetical protein